jgi:hypothetical protein
MLPTLTVRTVLIAMAVAASVFTAVPNVQAQSCDLLFAPDGPKKNQITVPYFRMTSNIAGVPRKITFVRPEDFDRYQRLVQKENPVQLKYDGARTGTIAERESTLMTKFWVKVAQAVIKGFTRKDTARPIVQIQHNGPVLTSTRILEMKSELLAKASGNSEKVSDFWIQIGKAPMISGDVFLALAKEAEESSFARVELSQMVNATWSARSQASSSKA